MAITQNFLIGRTRKSAGGTRFSTWKGLNVIAAKPLQVRQNVTAAVTLNRNKLSVVGKFVKMLQAMFSVVYSLGIQKTTEFAETVKFFRNKIKDDLKLDITLLVGSSFGTSNATGNDYIGSQFSISAFVLDRVVSSVNALFDNVDTDLNVLVFNDSMTKSQYFPAAASGDQADVTLDLSDNFAIGDKVFIMTSCKKDQPGNNLQSKMKAVTNIAFMTIVA